VQTAAVQRAQGRLDEAATALQIFRKQYPWVPTWRCEYTLVLALLGREDEARAEFEELAGGDFADLRRDLTWLTAIAFLAETAAILRDRSRAALLYELLLPHASRTVSVSPGVACYGSVARYLGRLAATLERDAEAVAHLETALTANSRLGARPYVAETQADLAALLAARERDPARTRELAGQARATALDLSMAPLLARVAEIERQLGATPKATRPSRRR
jgi:tetratricopeptide (TPR) repeat protein